MVLNRDHIGAVSETRFVRVELGQLKLFAKAIGETNPIHFDEEAAMNAGHPGVVAPLTFGNCLRQIAPARSPSYADLGIDYRNLLHAEEAFEYLQPIYAGDRLSLVTEIKDMFEKKGGALEFMKSETRINSESNDLLQRINSTIVMRRGGKG